MTIRKRLYLNIVIVTAAIVLIIGLSLFGMRFVRENLSILTEQSTPYQLRTVELQRSLQEHTANLQSVVFSFRADDFSRARTEAEKSLAEVKAAEEALHRLKGGSGAAGMKNSDIAVITGEIITVTGERLGVETATGEAAVLMRSRLSESSRKLRELDASVRKIQKTSSESLVSSSASSRSIAQKLKHIQAAAQAVKGVQAGIQDLQTATEANSFIIAQNRVQASLKSLLSQISQLKAAGDTEFLRKLTADTADLQRLATGDDGLIGQKKMLLEVAVPPAGTEEKLKQNMTYTRQKALSISVLIQDEIEHSSERSVADNRNLDDSLKNSTHAGDILVMNSEFLTSGFRIESLAGRLFDARTEEELRAAANELKGASDAASGVSRRLREALQLAGRQEEAKRIKSASDTVEEIRGLLFGRDGVIDKISRKLSVNARVLVLGEELKKMVGAQKEAGRKGVSAAQSQQEESISSVNRVVRLYLVGVLIAGTLVLLIVIVFSKMLERSVSRPVTELGTLAERFGTGDFALKINEQRTDEFGRLGHHFNKASGKLQDIVVKMRTATGGLASSSEQLSATADVLEKGSQGQTLQIEQAATAITEMSQTTMDVAKNASETAAAAQKMKTSALEGQEGMEVTVAELNKFADTFRQAAQKIEGLGKKSDEIKNVVTLIKEIADQTNLLALNAAIEAARAGDQGRGFAVVADNVRQLAERTAKATDDIGTTVRTMQSEVKDSVDFMKKEKDSVEIVLEKVKGTRKSIEDIVIYVEQVADMVQRIAVATEEQSSTSDMVSHSMEDVAVIARQLGSSIFEIKRASGDLSRLAAELNSMAGWFKT
ncbi:MAG: hypothetical protein C0402_16315 [Thermodesulfovibrio sp.]|nr:hypothetical protein [Thermodesulfovibrio sp.]